MSRLDDALADAEARQTEREEVSAGDPLGYVIPALTDLERLEIAQGVESIDRHALQPTRPCQQGMPSRPHVKPWIERHPDSEAF